MSLIFKALQRVGQTGEIPADGQVNSTPATAVHPWRRWLRSPLVVLGAAAGIFVSGVLVSHAVNVISARNRPLAPAMAAASSSQQTGLPSMQTEIQATAWQPESAPLQSSKDARDVTYHVRPSGAAGDQSVSPASTGQVRFHPAGSPSAPEPGVSAKEKTEVAQPSMPLGTIEQVVHRGDTQPYEDKSTALKTAALAGRAAVSEWVPGQRPRRPSISSAPELAPVENPPDPFSETAAKGFPQINRQQQSAQAIRHRKVSRLAHNILSAIQADDVALSSELIRQLVRIKGSQNDFALKLKAYSLIRQGRLDEARTILTQVLAHSANDLEAGLNMAVIEIKSGRYDPARRRLTHLRELYPEEARIGSYLRQLPRK